MVNFLFSSSAIKVGCLICLLCLIWFQTINAMWLYSLGTIWIFLYYESIMDTLPNVFYYNRRTYLIVIVATIQSNAFVKKKNCQIVKRLIVQTHKIFQKILRSFTFCTFVKISTHESRKCVHKCTQMTFEQNKWYDLNE